MKKMLWILLALVFIAVIVFTMPSAAGCTQHDFVYRNGCAEMVCVKCGKAAILAKPSHTLESLSCSQAECTVCGEIVSGNYHQYQSIPCTNKKQCSACNLIFEFKTVSHNRMTIMDGCTTTYVCSDCGIHLNSITSHEWASKNCEEGFYCKRCGSTDSPDHFHGHSYTALSDFVALPSVCWYCGKLRFPQLTVGAACVYLGLMMCIAAFIFIFINRQRIRVREGRFFCTLTPDSQLRVKGTEEEFS